MKFALALIFILTSSVTAIPQGGNVGFNDSLGKGSYDYKVSKQADIIHSNDIDQQIQDSLSKYRQDRADSVKTLLNNEN